MSLELSRLTTHYLCVCRIGIDEWLRVPSVADVFAIGDCCGYLESTGKPTLPALAQVSAPPVCTFATLGVFMKTVYPKSYICVGFTGFGLVYSTPRPYICVGFTGYI